MADIDTVNHIFFLHTLLALVYSVRYENVMTEGYVTWREVFNGMQPSNATSTYSSIKPCRINRLGITVLTIDDALILDHC